MTQRRFLYVILVAYVLLGVIYSVVTPVFEVSDELWHYPMVKYMADHGLALPPQDPTNPGPWRQEGSQPPLYYILSAILTSGINTSDMDTVRRINPHADIGVVRPDGNTNMIVHRSDAEAFPWRGTVLAVQVIRLFSVGLGLATVIVTYQLAREIFPEQPVIALGAAALNAFLPMFLFISASVNNDNLSNLLGNLLTLLVVKLLKFRPKKNRSNDHSFDFRPYILIGIVTGAGLLAKLNIGFLIPVVALALLIVSYRARDWRPLVTGGVISGGLTILIAGWWYARNWQLYGDPTGLSMFLQMVGRRAVPANAAQLWSERHSFTQAYWGFFGGVNVPLPETVYLIFNVIGGIGLIGAAGFIGYSLARRHWTWERWLPAVVTLIWPMVTFMSYLRWTAETPASQGRLVFGALSSISLWMAVGLVWWLPRRAQPAILAGTASYFAAAAALAPFVVIAPAYAPPPQVEAGDSITTFRTAAHETGLIKLSRAELFNSTVQPEQYVLIDTEWQMVSPTEQNWSLFVHLVTPDEVIIGQRDVYPGQGKLATSDLPAGRAWENPAAVWVPPAAYAPMRLNVEIGWYDLKTGERLVTDTGAETVLVGQVELLPRASAMDVPNPMRVDFGDLIELVGYSLSDLSPEAGDTVELTLYWRGKRKIADDYKVFANILDPKTLTKHAASDGMPANWNAPTSTWQAGTIIEDKRELKVDPNTPPGIYELEIGLYREAPDGTLPRLLIIKPDGGMADNFLYLSRVRVLPMEKKP